MREKDIYEIRKCDMVMLWNQPALFTTAHINQNTIPEGYYAYEIRHDPANEACPRLLAKRIMQDYYGTVLINRPIQLNACGWKRLEDRAVQFIENQKMAADQYIEQYPAEKEEMIQLYILDHNVKELFEEPAENKLLENLYMGVVCGKIHSKGRCSFVAKKQFEDEAYPDYLKDYQRVLVWLRTDGPLESLYKMAYFCAYYGEQARIPNDDTLSYGFCMETEYYKYFLRCTPVIGEEHFYLYGYQKHKTKR